MVAWRQIIRITIAFGLSLPATTNIHAGSIELLEDVRRIDVDLTAQGRFGAPELDTPAAPFGSSYFDEDSRSQSGIESGLEVSSVQLAGQSSTISVAGQDARIAARLYASAGTVSSSARIGPNSRAATDLTLTFRTEIALDFIVRYSAFATGDESLGGTFRFREFGGRVGGFEGGGGFSAIQRSLGADSITNDYEFLIKPDDESLAPVTVNFSGSPYAFIATGTINPGEFQMSAIADAGSDSDDSGGGAGVAFEILLSPSSESAEHVIPMPTALVSGLMLLGSLGFRRPR